MKISLQTSGENAFHIEFKKCPMCGNLKGVRDKHHIIPKFLDPVMSMTIPICKKCHRKLNASYVKHPKSTPNNVSSSYEEFMDNY